jgi:hypothetical protein
MAEQIKDCRFCEYIKLRFFSWGEQNTCTACKEGSKFKQLLLTPAQFKERFGHEWPKDAPVWVRALNRKKGLKTAWGMTTMIKLHNDYPDDFPGNTFELLCAIGPNKPADDWRPE